MKSFGLIFVLFQPGDEFLNNLTMARALCPNVVAVDNSPDADRQVHNRLRDQGIEVIVNNNEGGLAGAYNKGVAPLLAAGCDVMFLLDQDSRIDSSFFAKMMEAVDELDTDTFLVGPKIYEIELERCMPVIPPGPRRPTPVRIDDRASGLFPTLCIISSGSAISAEAYRKLGPFREDYFIEFIDIEYSLRANSQGVPVYMNAAVTLRQTHGHIERRGGLFTTHHPAWRRYYGARNAAHCFHLYRSRWALRWWGGLLTLHQAVAVLLFDADKVNKLVAIACGALDAMRGRLGRFEDRHPHIAAFCERTRRRRHVDDRPPVLAVDSKS